MSLIRPVPLETKHQNQSQNKIFCSLQWCNVCKHSHLDVVRQRIPCCKGVARCGVYGGGRVHVGVHRLGSDVRDGAARLLLHRLTLQRRRGGSLACRLVPGRQSRSGGAGTRGSTCTGREQASIPNPQTQQNHPCYVSSATRYGFSAFDWRNMHTGEAQRMACNGLFSHTFSTPPALAGVHASHLPTHPYRPAKTTLGSDESCWHMGTSITKPLASHIGVRSVCRRLAKLRLTHSCQG